MTNLPPDPISPEPIAAEHSALADRLRDLGRIPLDPAVASAHLTAIAAARAGSWLRPVHGRFGRVKVVAAFAAGLVLGGTGLASAGALGSTPQNAVADTAAHVGLDLPGGTTRSTEGCGGKTYRNHGAFVSQGGDPHSPCGKPLKSTDKPDESTRNPDKTPAKPDKSADKPDDADHAPGAGAPKGCGRPPWAGRGNHAKKTPAAVAAHRAACGDDGSDADGEPPTTSAGAAAPEATTTTAATTTTVAVTTTIAATTTTATAPTTATTGP